MHIPRFFIVEAPTDTGAFSLPAEAAHHALRVLRLGLGDAIQLFDGSGQQWAGEISQIDGSRCMARLALPTTPSVEPKLQIHLGQGLLPSEKFDWVLQKSVELGVAAITPLQLQRSIVRLGEARSDKKRAHWQGVVRAAAEQSGRVSLPKIHSPLSLAQWIEHLPEGCMRFCLNPEAQPFSVSSKPEAIALVIGPEGGFDPGELRLLEAAGFKGVALGPRVLRAETAALAAIAAFQVWCGDFGGTGL